jgi:lysophospholipase L1-like esterase
MSRRILVVAVAVCVVSLLACGGTERAAYLALGDSYAYGEGASDRVELGYVPLFHEFLEEDMERELALRNLAVGGETTASMIAEGQLAKALAELKFRNQDDYPDNDVLIITIDIGGNDLNHLAKEGEPCAPPTPITDPACTTAITNALDEVSMNLPLILRALRVAAGPDVRIIVLNYFNPFSGSGKPLDEAADVGLPLLNDCIREAAETPGIDAEVVDTFEDFKGRAPELTHVMDPEEDFHPNDEGYRLMADLLIAAYER